MMKTIDQTSQNNCHNRRERGAALVTVLIMTGFLMVAGSALLYVASVHTANVTDAVAEEQAYYAAESGVQMVLNVLRGNVDPNPLINTSKPASDPANKINYRRALTLSTSNITGDTASVPQLSRWIPYNFVNNSSNVSSIGTSLPNQPAGLGFRVQIEDPNNTNSITFDTIANFSNPLNATDVSIVNSNNSSVTFGSGSNKVVITFVPNSTTINVSSGSDNTDLGGFKIESYGTGAALPDDIRFSIVYRMNTPRAASRVIRGWITKGTVSSNSVGTLKLDFDTKIYELAGGNINLDVNDPLTPNAPSVNGGVTQIRANITQIMPQRIVVRSTGFGPRGAQKQLEAFVQKDVFGGLTAPATITMVGNNNNNGFKFEPGNSNAKRYSGKDYAGTEMMIPPVGTAVPGLNVSSEVSTSKGEWNNETPSDVTAELPEWLQSTANLDSTIKWLKLIATSSGRYYASGVTPLNLGGVTFIDGNVNLHRGGSGILVCTGKLTLNGNFGFQGLIIVTGEGGVERNGGGNGEIFGHVVVAPYDSNNINQGFKSPEFETSGGGNSTVQYSSKNVFDAINSAGNVVIGIAQK